ncbi:MAG: chorismate lyase [Kangiellaceae bacterium]
MSFLLKANSLALLTEQDSLTELMKSLMGSAPKLDCLFEGRAKVSRDERQLLDIPARQMAHVREITMGTSKNLWLFARTVIPKETLAREAHRLSRMRKVPLGKVLFGQLKAQRIQMRLDLVFAEEVNLQHFDISSDFPLWQRRSIFQLNTGRLLISEIFLPNCPVYE